MIALQRNYFLLRKKACSHRGPALAREDITTAILGISSVAHLIPKLVENIQIWAPKHIAHITDERTTLLQVSMYLLAKSENTISFQYLWRQVIIQE